MTLEGKFDLMHYSKHQRKFVFNHYERFCNDTNTRPSMSWYLQHIYIKCGLANKFHDEYIKKYKGFSPVPPFLIEVREI